MSTAAEQNSNFLNELYRNTGMGINAINTLVTKTDDDNLKKDLETQLHQFRAIEVDVENEIEQRGIQTEPVSKAGKAGLWSSIKMNMMIDKTPSHIAQMMIEGANMGIIDLTRALHENSMADAQIKSIASRLLEVEKQSADTMKAYL